ncbi:tRNA threonylcarbamoyl adenosine modification protein YeaZ [Phycicoccus badiiscoriae]|uniref:tRNA threonylcarbamoyl adenosine modification protein YeaZ n=1 Tax=Pedococcus badiiscoriae TaxID=642776 RepID=A0A852WMH6_9MICO|nr:tRNA (adenosine(37)-N6)-threonylcarbamoyltransferase complex dimerization subunit type 1 TsaB [Pedococcus badiiscoriae]NYG07445.1 tRNA threonylcarbamoyl adenosine modification protein YeaZ [Pedococcus badiiscoriae]
MSRVVLSIDTSTSVRVAVSAGADWAQDGSDDPRGHTEAVAPLMRDLLARLGLAPTDVTDVVVGNGPGPFTGLRVGIVSGLVFGHAMGIPVHGVCSLDVLAQQAVEHVREGEFVVATDARRKEVYWARYRVDPDRPEQDRAVRLTEPAVARPADVPEEVRGLPTAGRGPVLYPELFPRPVAVLDVSAGVLGDLALQRLSRGETLPVEPLYLRRPDALTTAERARA